MRFACSHCGRAYVISDELAGRAFKMKCKGCGHEIVVRPAAAAKATPAKATPAPHPPEPPPRPPEPPPHPPEPTPAPAPVESGSEAHPLATPLFEVAGAAGLPVPPGAAHASEFAAAPAAADVPPPLQPAPVDPANPFAGLDIGEGEEEHITLAKPVPRSPPPEPARAHALTSRREPLPRAGFSPFVIVAIILVAAVAAWLLLGKGKETQAPAPSASPVAASPARPSPTGPSPAAAPRTDAPPAPPPSSPVPSTSPAPAQKP